MPHVQLREVVMYYEEVGEGPPLLLITGLGGHSGAWALQIPALARSNRVIAMDPRGAGRTSAPDKPYSIAGMAEDIAQLMDALEIAKASVVGLSLGGSIALDLASAHPDRIENLVLIGATARPDGRQRLIAHGLIAVRRSSLSGGEAALLLAPWVGSSALLADTPRLKQAIGNFANDPYPTPDHSYVRQAQALLDYDATDRLAAIEHPTLVLAGEEDILVAPANGAAIAEAMPNATLRELPGGHMGMAEYTQEYTAAILQFLAAPVPASA